MANYIFQKEAQLRLVCDDVGGTLRNYRIDINEIEFSQSFQEKSYSVKTIHNQSSFEGSSINRANPAEFSFSTPLLEEARHKVVFDGTFEINKSRPLRLSISGEASKLSKFSGSIPGTVDTGLGYDTTTYIIPKINTLTLGGTDVSGQVVGVTVEVQNDINWNNYNTLQASVTATNAATSMFPSTFTIGTRVVAGAITRYIKDSPDLLTWDTNTALVLKAGTVGSFKGVSFDFNCSFTNRLQSSGIYAEEYSWRMTERPTALSSVITYT